MLSLNGRWMWTAAALAVGSMAGIAYAQAPAATSATSNEGRSAIETIHTRNIGAVDFGNMLIEKATSPKVKDFGRKLVSDHERLDRELTQLASKRGIQLQDKNAVLAANPGHGAAMSKLRALQGQQFDQAAMDLIATQRASEVTEWKHLRDSMSGKDAELKKWVDNGENVLESERNLARDLRSEVQRQGRRPPQ